jgi:hypothetical protein
MFQHQNYSQNLIKFNTLLIGKKAALVILTDGEASDGDIVAAMRPLYQLPVWVVIRLCTDNDQIVDYWNNIDSQIELNMDVIDDPLGEAKEIYEHNKWFTYGEPLHRLREFGNHMYIYVDMYKFIHIHISVYTYKYICK